MEKSGFSRNERIILFLSTTAALFVLAVLFHRSQWWSDRHGNIVAVVSEAKNDVRYRSSDEFIWNSARGQLKVVNEDQFFIGDKSSLKITTVNGEELQFSENSMAIIRIQDGKVQAELLLGQGQSIVGGQAQVLPNQSMRQQKANSPIKKIVPKLALREPDPEPPAAVKPEPPPAPEPKVEAKSEPPRPPIAKPKWWAAESVRAEVERVTARERLNGMRDKVKISWASSEKIEPARVLIKDLQGRTIKMMRTTESEIEWAGAEPGAYQVFVEKFHSTTRKPSADGGSNVFEIPNLKKLALGRPVFPHPNQTIVRSSGGFSLPIQTKASVGALETQVQISREARFSQIEFTHIFDGNSYVLREPLAEGIWYLRTRTIGEYAISEWSTPLRFQILDP